MNRFLTSYQQVTRPTGTSKAFCKMKFKNQDNPTRKLSANDIALFKRLIAEGVTRREAGRRIGITDSYASKLARGHYWRQEGSEAPGPVTPRLPLEQRFWQKVEQSPDCWEWKAYRDNCGYGRFKMGKSMRNAHAVAYELLVGEVPDGFELDHLCRNRGCVNPAHLEVVTHRTNTMRGVSPHALNAKKTHCINGHEFNAENTYFRPGPTPRRDCRQCLLIKSRSYYARKRQREVAA